MYAINNLTFYYERENPVFRGFSLTIPRSEITVLIGRNGAGKTTLARLLTGLINNYQGSILLQHSELSKMKQRDLLEQVLYIKQDLTGNLMGITPAEDLQIWQNRFLEQDNPGKKQLREEALTQLGIGDLSATPVWEQSYGQKRRTMLSVTPLFPNRFWILDEPTASLDKEGIALLLKLIARKRESGSGMLILTHRPELFTTLTDNLYLLENGLIIKHKELK